MLEEGVDQVPRCHALPACASAARLQFPTPREAAPRGVVLLVMALARPMVMSLVCLGLMAPPALLDGVELELAPPQ